MNVYTVMMTC